jgi:hypothetical protein
MDGKKKIDWVISMGKWASSDWTPRNASGATLFPGGFGVPYVSQLFTGGNDCELDEPEVLDGDEEVATLLRQTELRLMCSPDTETHAVITEPKQCRYVVEYYLPSLCMEGFTPGSHDLVVAAVAEEAEKRQKIIAKQDEL